MVLLVGALIDRPDGVVLDFRLKADGRADVTAGFLGLARRDIGAIFKGQPRLLEEESPAELAGLGRVLIHDRIEQVHIPEVNDTLE